MQMKDLQEWTAKLSFNEKQVNLISQWDNPILKNRLIANCINWLTGEGQEGPHENIISIIITHSRYADTLESTMWHKSLLQLFGLLFFDRSSKLCLLNYGRLQWEPRSPRADGSFCYNQSAKHWIMQTLMSSMQTFSHSLTAALPQSHKSIHYYR